MGTEGASITDPNPALQQTVARVVEQLRSQGQRVTVARRAVIEALADGPGHPNVDEVYAAVEAKMPDVHLATVYRTLDTLTELGIVTHVHIGHGPSVYHLQEPGRLLGHLHAQCRLCKSIVDLPADVLAEARARLVHDQSFTLDVDHVALSGVCGDCARDASTLVN